MTAAKQKQPPSDYLDVGNGHSIYWTERGSPDGAPVLLVHGGNGYLFDEQALHPLEKSGLRLIIMHQRGIGQSTPAGKADHNGIQDNIDDIERLRAHLGVEKWDVMSWSFGTVFAAGYLFEHPEHCKSLTAYAPYLGSDEDYKTIARTAPKEARAYYKFHGAKSGKGIVTSVFNKAAAPDFSTRFTAYYNAVAMMSEKPLDKAAFLKTKTAKEWDDFFKTRYISAQHDLELHTSKARFLEKRAQTAPQKMPPIRLVYGSKDTWAAPTAYARKIFPQHKAITLDHESHDVHSPRIMNALARIINRDQGTKPRPAANTP